MKKIILSLSTLLVSVASMAQTWTLDKAHSNVGFTVTHMMLSEVDGSFKGYDAKLTSEKADFSDAKFEFSAPISGISTGMEMRDGHLQGEGWFNAAKFNNLTFKSTSIKKVKGNVFKITGNLTMHGVTKPIVLNATLRGPIVDERSKKQKMGITASGTVNRVAFGVGTAGGGVSDDVVFKVAGEFSKD